MDNQLLVTLIIVICSLSGWYVVLHKYLELKAMLKIKTAETANSPNEVVDSLRQQYSSQPPMYTPDQFFNDLNFVQGKHIPGIGPPPLAEMPLHIPSAVLARMQKQVGIQQQAGMQQTKPTGIEQLSSNSEAMQNMESKINLNKRTVCNWASVLHLSGFSVVTGIPFINIIVPAILWLCIKERHPYLTKQGREVINFQITFSLIQFLCLGLGSLFVWLLPDAAAALFAWTKTVRVIFSTSMLLPFNLFTALPFFWGCALMVRGAVAAYHGISFKYPYSQPFVFEGDSESNNKLTQKSMQRKEPKVEPNVNPSATPGKISFG